MKFNIMLDREEDGIWVSECPSIPGCTSQRNTHEEAIENIRAAIYASLEVLAAQGLPLTVEMRYVEVAV